MSRDLPPGAEYSLGKIAAQLEIANELKAVELRRTYPADNEKINDILRGEFY